MKSDESCAVGKYFSIAALVDGSNTARAAGTLCLQFPGCRTVDESFGGALRCAWVSLYF